MHTDDVKKQIAELELLRKQTRRFSRITIILLIGIVLVGAGAIIDSFYRLAFEGPKQDLFVKHLGERLKVELLPAVTKIAGGSIQRLKPAVNREVDRINALAPEIADVALRELDTLDKELPTRAEKILDQTFGAALQAREKKLRRMYPGTYDAKIADLIENLNLEAQDQIAATSEKIFSPHLNSLQGILTSLEKIQKTEPVNNTREIGLMQVVYLFADVFVQEFDDFSMNDHAKK